MNYLGQSEIGATFSPCRTYRYCLWRRWQPNLTRNGFFGEGSEEYESPSRLAAFIGLNPSTADETQDDPTIRRCIGFAKSWGCNGLVMLNIFAFRATDPKEMKKSPDPVGPENDTCLRRVCSIIPTVVACWGTHGAFMSRGPLVRANFAGWWSGGKRLQHLGLTKHGHPKHPLYLKADTPRTRW